MYIDSSYVSLEFQPPNSANLYLNQSVLRSFYISFYFNNIFTLFFILGADFKNNQTTKQLNNLIWTNRKVETKLYLLPIGPNQIV